VVTFPRTIDAVVVVEGVGERDMTDRYRGVASVICVVLAALATAPAVGVEWARRTVLDSQRYVATVGPLATYREVQDVMAQFAIEALEKRVDVPRVLAGPTDREVRAFVASSAFEDLWTTINATSQQALVRALRGDPDGVLAVQGDALILDGSAVVEVIRRRLVVRGLTALERVRVPSIDTQVVLVRGPQLARAQAIYDVAAPVAPWALPVTGLLYLAALALAVQRSRMLIAVGICLAVSGLVIVLALWVARQRAIGQLADTPFAPATGVAFDALVADLVSAWQVMLGLGIVLAVAGRLMARRLSRTTSRWDDGDGGDATPSDARPR
jgi:hypothetical protein